MTQPTVPAAAADPPASAAAEAAASAPPSPAPDSAAAQIAAGYAFQGPVLRLGAVVHDGTCFGDAQVTIPLSMMNRHGLIAGATGTGKTKTLQVVAEQLSAAGVPVFAADIKSDLSGLAVPGTSNDKIAARRADLRDDWTPTGFPVEFFSLGGDRTRGVPLRATVTSFGPLLLAKVLGLNATQESSLSLMFHWADQNGLPLLDLKDLRSVVSYLTSAEGKQQLGDLGGVSKATAGVILRQVTQLQTQGADAFFGEPEFDTHDLLRTTTDGMGVISLVELADVQDRPVIFSTFLMWLLADLFADLPEVGDLDRPKLVFFFDEAHLLFNDASKAFLDAVTQTVRLVRSKGIGVFFITQRPTDVPSAVLAQLGNRVQHALRAFTPEDADALAKTVRTYPTTDNYDLREVLTSLGTGEAIVTVMSESGAPTPVAWTRLPAPRSLMAPCPPQTLADVLHASALMARYGESLDRDSAYERLADRTQGAGREPVVPPKRSPRTEAGPLTDKAAPRRDRPAPRRRPGREEPTAMEQFFDNGVVKQFMRSAAAAIGRNLFGTARRRR